ncbi:MAG TPA: NUDIX domain-containing protein [Lacibacter sp.]|nr:NUDIX domain-containing protein [Lacibacter sp.]HMO90253.1 NUDIX domain-containing protein [Lacibacter sp.]HMP87147.1 NUDIX domain-containing protein [Lacibacter sp.]
MITVRVYGILITPERRVLVSDEFIRGGYYTKFPGGGLEVGEGTRDCLRREFVEEMNLLVEVGAHLYTTDFYQQSAFNQSHQILSIYYYAHPLEPFTVSFRERPFDFLPEQTADPRGEAEVFRLLDWEQFSPDAVTLPIDKIVARMVKEHPPF